MRCRPVSSEAIDYGTLKSHKTSSADLAMIVEQNRTGRRGRRRIFKGWAKQG
jgi:hypothetical protein